MGIVKNTLEAFPRGRTTNELFALLDVDFKASRREEIRAELLALQQQGAVVLGRDKKWRAISRVGVARNTAAQHAPAGTPFIDSNKLVAAPGTFLKEESPILEVEQDSSSDQAIDPIALLKYYRAALQSDPRGALTQADDRHGTAFQLVSGNGDLVPGENEIGVVRISLENLPDSFREALSRRDANEKTMAVGWPIAVSKRNGAPSIQPVGLIAATWDRDDLSLRVRIDTDDVMVNPDWVKALARNSAWSEAKLFETFTGQAGTGLSKDAFLAKVKEAAARLVVGKITGRNFAATLDPNDEGIFDAMGFFLPTETSFTSGAVRDLDVIATWDSQKISRTALGQVLGLPYTGELRSAAPINVGPLNHEQIQATANSLSTPFSVVTGPPGTGKSQAIVAMVASEILQGGSVVVASKNHQALDAVEERLSEIAPSVNFCVRTLDPSRDIDQGMVETVAELVREPSRGTGEVDPSVVASLASVSERRQAALEQIGLIRTLNTRLADTVEKIDLLEKESPEEADAVSAEHKSSLWARILGWLFGRAKPAAHSTGLDNISELKQDVLSCRKQLMEIGTPGDPVVLTEETESLAKTVMRRLLEKRAALTEDQRISLSNQHDDLTLHGGETMSRTIAQSVLEHRPLWLASVLGVPRRIPLYEGLFDLVVFDEASQCDIASALPLLARAKRAVVVGDDRQLAFIPQIGLKQDRNLMASYGLPPRGTGRFSQGRKSLFDLSRSTPKVPAVMLRDQYRSAEDIVGYINDAFYGGKLRVSADLSRLKLPKGQKPGLAWTDVSGPAVVSHGSQNVNMKEVSAIVSHVEALLTKNSYGGSIGVISPFRSQVQELDKALRERIPADLLQASDLRVGTVDGFQGQERDLILFSPTVHSRIRSSAVTFIQRDWRRLNVAISRARAVAHVFGDLNFAQSGKIKQLRTLAARATSPTRQGGEGVFDSEWERVVFHALKARGLDPKPQYQIMGRRLDFALFGEGDIKLDLEIDGRRWHQDADGNRKLDDHWRDHLMRSAGWKIQRFWVDELKQDMEACLDLVERELSK